MSYIVSEAAGAMAAQMMRNGLGAFAAVQKAIEMELEAGKLLVAPEKVEPVVEAPEVVDTLVMDAPDEGEEESEMSNGQEFGF